MFPWRETRYVPFGNPIFARFAGNRAAAPPGENARNKWHVKRLPFSLYLSVDMFAFGKLDMFPSGTRYLPFGNPIFARFAGNRAAAPPGQSARSTEKNLKSMDLAFKFRFFSLCFVPPYRSKDQGRGPKPGHSYWIKQNENYGFYNRPVFNVFLSKTCRETAHIEQGEQSRAVYIV